MKFSSVVGQNIIKEHLVNLVRTNSVSHAFLFYGTEGSGKIALAIAFARYLSCTNKKEHDSCGECPSCLKFEKLIHPDLHFVFPVIKDSKLKSVSDSYIKQWREFILTDPYFSISEWLNNIANENKQASIFAEESNEILKKLSLKTYESEYKTMIIWLPEKMNASAANKLLKILEEPPEKTVFILVSDNREAVLPTILSRVHAIKIKGIDKEAMLDKLSSEFNENKEKLNDVYKLSGGSLLKAKLYLQASEQIKYNFESFVDLMRCAYSRNIDQSITWAKDIASIGRERQKNFLSYSLRLIRENFIYNKKIYEVAYLLDMEKDFTSKFSQFINEKNVYKILKVFEDAHFHIERNANAKILFTDLSFKIMAVIR